MPAECEVALWKEEQGAEAGLGSTGSLTGLRKGLTYFITFADYFA